MNQMNNRKPSGGGYRLTPEQRRRILERRKRQKRRKRLMIIVPSAAVFVLAAVLVLVLPVGSQAWRSPAADSTAPVLELSGDADVSGGEEITAEETVLETTPEPEPTLEPTENPNAYKPANGVFVYDDAYAAAALGLDTGPLIVADLSKVDPEKADRWPAATEGYMPILYSANTTEKIIAITVDDCNQASNLRQIVQCALDNNGQLTIFPIGKNLTKDSIASVIKWAWENGMEIENHTYNHAGMYHYDDERMINEMWMQNVALSNVLGVNYQEHFFRPKGGDERSCQRVHAYANQMGMQGIAIWVQSGSSNPVSALTLKPGAIYLFHTTDTDLERLLEFIPLATRQGYRLVTMNEMFGLPDNETSDLSTMVTTAPALKAFHITPADLKKTMYIRAAAVVQKRLIELGWLSGEADGVYGQSSYMATGYFQLAADLKADGRAGPATQAALFSDDALAATSENKAKVKAKMNK